MRNKKCLNGKSELYGPSTVIDFLTPDSSRPHRDLIDRFCCGVATARLRIEFVLMIL